MPEVTYALAKQGIFRTVQGEGQLLGLPMTFVRLAGCSVGCGVNCDTDYSRATAQEIAAEVAQYKTQWTWVTGGEPADHDLAPLLSNLRLWGKIAVATSGHKPLGSAGRMIDFLSVSPHSHENWIIRRGSQLNLVPGLGGLCLDKFFAENHPNNFRVPFGERYLTPMFGSKESLDECLKWLDKLPHGEWRLGVQAHRQWGLP